MLKYCFLLFLPFERFFFFKKMKFKKALRKLEMSLNIPVISRRENVMLISRICAILATVLKEILRCLINDYNIYVLGELIKPKAFF